MRVITEESANQRTEMIDGIKVMHDEGSWALILPDANEPTVHVFAEAGSQKAADELAHRYALRLTALRG
jgi:mannose-1-phosphate guanylyltransferase/phosphomannomutase